VSSVRSTTFNRNEPKFQKAVKDFGHVSAAKVLSDIDDFEFDWRHGMEDDQLRASYKFKEPHYEHRPYYRLFQIRVGPNRRNLSYRAIMMFYDKQLRAHWVHAFKKENDNEPQEILLAVMRADECWHKITKTRRTQ